MVNSLKKGTHSIFSIWYCIFFLMISAGSFSSCITVRNSSYFKNVNRDTVVTVANSSQGEIKIQKGDILSLSISSLNKEEDLLYNSAPVGSGYEVDNNGEIQIHHLGKIKAQDLTRKQLKAKLEEGLLPYLKDPVVLVTFVNHHVTVLGSVGIPHILPMPTEKISIVDLLASTGTFIPMSDLSNVVVIRDSGDDKKLIRHINLEDHSVFTSDFFYLKPNDVVVVKPDEQSLRKEQKRLQYQQVSSIILQGVTIALLIYQTFFRN